MGIHQTDDDAESATIRNTNAKTETKKDYPQREYPKRYQAAEATPRASQPPHVLDVETGEVTLAKQDNRDPGDAVEGYGQEDGSEETADAAGKVAALKKGLLGVLAYCEGKGWTEQEMDKWIKARFNVTDVSTLRLTESQLSIILTKFSKGRNENV